MKKLGTAFNPDPVLKSEKQIQSIPASNESVMNFYIADHDLNLAHSRVEIIEAKGAVRIYN